MKLIRAFGHNLGQNIWNKLKKSSKIVQDPNTLVTVTTLFLTAITKNLYWEED